MFLRLLSTNECLDDTLGDELAEIEESLTTKDTNTPTKTPAKRKLIYDDFKTVTPNKKTPSQKGESINIMSLA